MAIVPVSCYLLPEEKHQSCHCATSDRITRQIGESRDTFRAQSGELAGSADATVDKIKTLMDTVRQKTTEMAATGDMLEGRAHKLSTLFVQKTKAILAAAEEAESRATQLERQKLDVETDIFLKDAVQVIERLQAISVDITRAFQPSVEEDLWKRYHRGDQGAFLRHLSRSLTKSQMQEIKDRFEAEADFRGFVTRYLSEFEALTARVRRSDRSDVLTAVLTGSDIGRIYMILAKALGRVE